MLTVQEVYVYCLDLSFGRVRRHHWQIKLNDGRVFSSEIPCLSFETREECLKNLVNFAIKLGKQEYVKILSQEEEEEYDGIRG